MIEIALQATGARLEEIVEHCASVGITLNTKSGSFEGREILREMLGQLAEDTLQTKDARSYLDQRNYFVMLARNIHNELEGKATSFVGEVEDESAAVYIRARFPEAKAMRCVKP